MSSRKRQLAEVDGEGLVWGGIGFAASRVVGVALSPSRSQMGLENVVIVYLSVVAMAAAIGGRAAGLVSSLSAALSYNFFFTTPYYTLRIDSADQVVTVVLLFAGGLLASLGGRASRRAGAQAREEDAAIRLLHAVTLAVASGKECPTWTATAASRRGICARWAGRWCCRPRALRSTWSATGGEWARWSSCRLPRLNAARSSGNVKTGSRSRGSHSRDLSAKAGASTSRRLQHLHGGRSRHGE